MFQPRRSEFDPRVSAIVDHLRAIQKELGAIGKGAGRSTSDSAVAAGNQIAEAIGPILNDIVERFRRGQRWAADQTVSAGNQAVKVGAKAGNQAMKVGAKAGNEALERIADQAKDRPLFTIAVAVGVGVLIGLVFRRD